MYKILHSLEVFTGLQVRKHLITLHHHSLTFRQFALSLKRHVTERPPYTSARKFLLTVGSKMTVRGLQEKKGKKLVKSSTSF